MGKTTNTIISFNFFLYNKFLFLFYQLYYFIRMSIPKEINHTDKNIINTIISFTLIITPPHEFLR